MVKLKVMWIVGDFTLKSKFDLALIESSSISFQSHHSINVLCCFIFFNLTLIILLKLFFNSI
jgi:hypothetical protein